VEVYEDNGISGAKGRDKRPAFNRLHKDATRRKFDVVMAWSVDRLGRSLQDLVEFFRHLQETKVELFLHQQLAVAAGGNPASVKTPTFYPGNIA
jgi:DNA invertase Pin-like site-specific DNA recombinase